MYRTYLRYDLCFKLLRPRQYRSRHFRHFQVLFDTFDTFDTCGTSGSKIQNSERYTLSYISLNFISVYNAHLSFVKRPASLSSYVSLCSTHTCEVFQARSTKFAVSCVPKHDRYFIDDNQISSG